ncbi:MAG: PD-(D/E)XK nuclease family protein [Bacteroidota bacterium]
MKSFLEELAEDILLNYRSQLEDLTVVFPNKRAGLFLKKHLATKIQSPVWSPTVLSLEDFLFQFSAIKKVDQLTLVARLFSSFRKYQEVKEDFDSFFSWGEMLLRDFEEVDHHLVNPKQLFTYVKDDREIAENFYFLNEEQENVIRDFWQKFFPIASSTQQHFMATWKILQQVYEDFKLGLAERKEGYTSHIYRSLLEHIDQITIDPDKKILFAGFNALTVAEEQLLQYFITTYQARIVWDLDDYYLRDSLQEAGTFLRRYQQDSVFQKTFPPSVPQRIDRPRDIDVIGVSLEAGQAKHLGQELQKLLQNGAKEEDIVVILPQDYMLFPVLNALPASISKLNITMGYPLKDTPLYSLMESILEIQQDLNVSEEQVSFYYRSVVSVLDHPVFKRSAIGSIEEFLKLIKRNNQIRIGGKQLDSLKSSLVDSVFRKLGSKEALGGYLLSAISILELQESYWSDLELFYLGQLKLVVDRLEDILNSINFHSDAKMYLKLFRKVSATLKLPFEGEPLEGLQIMGAMESRNLDFKHVFLLNVNEDIFPSAQRKGSFIPYRIRKVFALPTFEEQDSIFAYLFYRLLQKSTSITCYYNTYAEFGMSGELSRFVRQLEYESKSIRFNWKKLSNPIKKKTKSLLVIQKSEEVLQKLDRFTNKTAAEHRRYLSASALNTYLECPLKFYFKYVLDYFSEEEITEELAPRNFGNVLHQSLEKLYQDLCTSKGDRVLEKQDFENLSERIRSAIQHAFSKEYGTGSEQQFAFVDRNIVMYDIIERFIKRVAKEDQKLTPLKIINIENEERYETSFLIQVNGEQKEVLMHAKIDKVDQYQGICRIVDYKTGKDENTFPSIESLFLHGQTLNSGKGRNKAAFQTMLYALIFAKSREIEGPLVPAIYGMKSIFKSDFDFHLTLGNGPIRNLEPYYSVFEELLIELLQELFDPEVPFRQHSEQENCKWCRELDLTSI